MSPSSSPFDFCARCGHARANHSRAEVIGAGSPGACLFSSCDCSAFVAPLKLEQLRELRHRFNAEALDARRLELGHVDDGHTRQAAEYRGFADGFDRAIAILDELVPAVRP